MKKEAVALALLLLILAGNLWNQRRLDALTTGLLHLASDAYDAAQRQDWAGAARAAEEAEKRWLEAERYTHIFLRHTDVDALTEALCELRAGAAGQEKRGLLAPYLRFKALLTGLRDMEKLRFGSVF